LQKAQSWSRPNANHPMQQQHHRQADPGRMQALEINYPIPLAPTAEHNASAPPVEAHAPVESSKVVETPAGKEAKPVAQDQSQGQEEKSEDVIENEFTLTIPTIEVDEVDSGLGIEVVDEQGSSDPAADAIRFQNKYLKARCDSLEQENQELAERYRSMQQNEKHWKMREEHLLQALDRKERQISELQQMLSRGGGGKGPGWGPLALPKANQDQASAKPRNDYNRLRNGRNKKMKRPRKKKVDPQLKNKKAGKVYPSFKNAPSNSSWSAKK